MIFHHFSDPRELSYSYLDIAFSPLMITGKFFSVLNYSFFFFLTVSLICKASFRLSFHDTVVNNDRFNKLICEVFFLFFFWGASLSHIFFPNGCWIIDPLMGVQGRSWRFLDLKLEKEETVLDMAGSVAHNKPHQSNLDGKLVTIQN